MSLKINMSKKNYWVPIACPSWSLSCLKKWLHFFHHFIPFHSITSVAYVKNLSVIIYCVQPPILLQSSHSANFVISTVKSISYVGSFLTILLLLFCSHTSFLRVPPPFCFFWACQVIPMLESLYLLFSVFRIHLKTFFPMIFFQGPLYIFAHISLSIVLEFPYKWAAPRRCTLSHITLPIYFIVSVTSLECKIHESRTSPVLFTTVLPRSRKIPTLRRHSVTCWMKDWIRYPCLIKSFRWHCLDWANIFWVPKTLLILTNYYCFYRWLISQSGISPDRLRGLPVLLQFDPGRILNFAPCFMGGHSEIHCVVKSIQIPSSDVPL